MTEDELIDALRESAVSVKLPPPATPEAIAEAEQAIGYPVPPLLRRLYLEVANGGFGPGLGVLGVPGEWDGVYRCDWDDIAEIYEAFTTSPTYTLPLGLVWFYDWGCAIWSLVDFRDPAGAMWGWDPNEGPEGKFFPERMSLAEWLAKDLDGSLDMPKWHEGDTLSH